MSQALTTQYTLKGELAGKKCSLLHSLQTDTPVKKKLNLISSTLISKGRSSFKECWVGGFSRVPQRIEVEQLNRKHQNMISLSKLR
ncbi:hypothetical protein V6Z90_005732 [Aspergillus fumigatus]